MKTWGKWIEWGGATDICPVPKGREFEYKLKNGGVADGKHAYEWRWMDYDCDIIAYRLADKVVSDVPKTETRDTSKSDGSTASYYELPEGATELQHLISYRNLNAQDGEMFRAIYRKGRASHSDALRDAKKVLFYAQAEVERLEGLK